MSQTDIPTYRRVRYFRLYPGIDCVFYGDQKGLEFDFQVSPGADPAKIRLRWSDAKRVRLDGNGELVIETASGELRQRKPTVYQERNGRRILVESGYVLAAKGEIRFSLGRYDRTLPLIIDPVLFALDPSIISIAAMAADPAGDINPTGSTSTSVLPTSAGVVRPVYGAGSCLLSSDDMPPVAYPCPEARVECGRYSELAKESCKTGKRCCVLRNREEGRRLLRVSMGGFGRPVLWRSSSCPSVCG